MASERELQNLEENDDDLLNLQAQMRVEGYRFEPRRPQSPILSDDSSTEDESSGESDGEMPVGAHAHVRDASCFQEPILAFFSAFGLSHWTIYYLSFFSMLTLSNFSVCPNFLLFV